MVNRERKSIGKKSIGREAIGREAIGMEAIDMEAIDMEVIDIEVIDIEVIREIQNQVNQRNQLNPGSDKDAISTKDEVIATQGTML